MMSSSTLVSNPLIILREEFDDWALLFDPDTGKSFGLNPVSVFIYKRLDGKHNKEQIVTDLMATCPTAPDDAGAYVTDFLNELVVNGLASLIDLK